MTTEAHTPKEMSLGDHLEELRRRLIYSLYGVAIALVVTLYYSRSIFTWMCEPLAEVQHLAGLPAQTVTRSALTGFTIFIKVGIISAAVIASPWIIYQFWKFIEAGLYPTERRVAVLLMPMSAALSVIGIFFMYYIFLPATLTFFIFFTTSYPRPATSGHSTIHKVSQFFMWFNDATMSVMGMGSPKPTLPATSLAQTQPATPGSSGSGSGSGSTSPSLTTSTQPSNQTPSPSTSPPLISQLPIFEEDPVHPLDGAIWFNKTENEVRLFIGGQIRSLTIATQAAMVPLIDPAEYINEVLIMTLVVVGVFQTPVVMTVLAGAGLVDPAWLSKQRINVAIGCFVAAVFITPSQDLFSNLLLPMLMYCLFEVGLISMRLVWTWNKEPDVGDE